MSSVRFAIEPSFEGSEFSSSVGTDRPESAASFLFFSLALASAACARTVATANADAAAAICPNRAACRSNLRWRIASCVASTPSPVEFGTLDEAICLSAWSAMSAASYLPRTASFAVLRFGMSLSMTSLRVSAAFMTRFMCVFCRLATDSAVDTAASAAFRVCSSSRRWRASTCCARSRSRRSSRRMARISVMTMAFAPPAMPVPTSLTPGATSDGSGSESFSCVLRKETAMSRSDRISRRSASNSARMNRIMASAGGGTFSSTPTPPPPRLNESPRFGAPSESDSTSIV